MTTKHVPATALPWEPLRGKTGIFGNEESMRHAHGVNAVEPKNYGGSRVVQLDANNVRRDMEYIAHAANAYPKLVEALHDVLQWANIGVSECDQGGDDTEAAEALLRSLGEEA